MVNELSFVGASARLRIQSFLDNAYSLTELGHPSLLVYSLIGLTHDGNQHVNDDDVDDESRDEEEDDR